MNAIGMSDLLGDMNQLEKEVITIALADREKYEYFLNKILELKQELFEIDDENSKNGSLDDQEIIGKVQELKFEFHQYLQAGEKDNDKIELVLSKDTESISGKENRKRYRINLYKSILEDLKKSSNIDLVRLKELRAKWEEEKESNWGYSPIEIDIIEDVFAEVFLRYQIKSLQKNGTMLKESFTEFCEQEKYEKKLKEKLLEKIQNLEPGTRKRLDLEQLFTIGNVEDIVNSKEFWSAVSGIDVKEEEKMDFNPPAESVKDKPISILQENTALVPLHNKSREKILANIQFHVFGKTIQIKKHFKISKWGGIAIPEFLKNKVFAIAFPEEMTQIKQIGLWQLKNLEQVYLPESLEEIGMKVFEECRNLKEVTIPQNLKRIGVSAFKYCTSLEKINLKKSKVSEIEDYTFEYCIKLKKVDLPNTVEQIGSYAFCVSGLRKINFPESLKSIGEAAFRETEIEQVELPNSVKKLGEGAFCWCNKLRKVKLSDNIKEIPQATFMDCQNLRDVSLPQRLVKIGIQAFYGCLSLKKIHLPERVREVEDFAFDRCLDLQEVEIENKKGNIKMKKNAFPFGVQFKKVSNQPRGGDDEQRGENESRKNWTNQEETHNAKAGNDLVL